MVAILLFLSVLVIVAVDYFLQRRKPQVGSNGGKAVSRAELGPAGGGPAQVRQARVHYRVPDGVFFDPGHTWLLLEETGVVKTGVDDFARSILGEVDGIVTRSVGEPVRKGEKILTLRRGNRTVSFRAPLDGVIDSVNTNHIRRHDPESTGLLSAEWVYRISPSDTSSMLDGLRIGQQAKTWLDRELRRIKVLLSTLAPEQRQLGETFQDGGTLVWGVIDQMSDEEWKQVRSKILG